MLEYLPGLELAKIAKQYRHFLDIVASWIISIQNFSYLCSFIFFPYALLGWFLRKTKNILAGFYSSEMWGCPQIVSTGCAKRPALSGVFIPLATDLYQFLY